VRGGLLVSVQRYRMAGVFGTQTPVWSDILSVGGQIIMVAARSVWNHFYVCPRFYTTTEMLGQ
jgi:hypothetical protein